MLPKLDRYGVSGEGFNAKTNSFLCSTYTPQGRCVRLLHQHADAIRRLRAS
jgi:hypothetical protein